MRPRVLTNALIGRPELFTSGLVLARIGNTGGLTVLDDFRQMD